MRFEPTPIEVDSYYAVWLEGDSNSRPNAYETCALPLSYPAKFNKCLFYLCLSYLASDRQTYLPPKLSWL